MEEKFVSPSSFWLPLQRSNSSPLIQHFPFFFWVLESARPRSFVQLVRGATLILPCVRRSCAWRLGRGALRSIRSNSRTRAPTRARRGRSLAS